MLAKYTGGPNLVCAGPITAVAGGGAGGDNPVIADGIAATVQGGDGTNQILTLPDGFSATIPPGVTFALGDYYVQDQVTGAAFWVQAAAFPGTYTRTF